MSGIVPLVTCYVQQYADELSGFAPGAWLEQCIHSKPKFVHIIILIQYDNYIYSCTKRVVHTVSGKVLTNVFTAIEYITFKGVCREGLDMR